MTIFVFIFLLALGTTLVGTPWVRRAALWLGFVDAPAQRKLHSTPVPLLGGVAIFGSALLAVLLLGLTNLPAVSTPQVRGILLATSLMATVGLIDDRRGLPAGAKLIAQIVAAVILIGFDVRVSLPVSIGLNYAITVFWLVGISNAINFLDNMDGLSAGISAVAAAFILLLGARNDQYLVAGLAAAVLGACLGFLRYNFRPARIFMGDAGSLFLGYTLAILGLQLRFTNSNVVTWMVPLFILGVPIMDTTLVVISRLRRRISPLTAGKDHSSHRLVSRGFSQREAVLILYLVGVAYGLVGIFVTEATPLEAYGLGVLTALATGFGIWRLERNFSTTL